MNSRARPPPLFVDLGLWDMAGVYIYFFSIVVVIIIINIIMEQFKQNGEEAECCGGTGQCSEAATQ